MTDPLVKSLSVCLTNLLIELEYANENQVNNDFAVSLMEATSAELQLINKKNLLDLISVIFEISASETDEKRKIFLENLPDNFGLANSTGGDTN